MGRNIVICENTFFSKGSNNAILLNYDTGMYYGLDSIGSEYWELIEKYKDFDLVLEKTHSKYHEVSREMLKSDLNELINELIGKGLVTVR